MDENFRKLREEHNMLAARWDDGVHMIDVTYNAWHREHVKLLSARRNMMSNDPYVRMGLKPDPRDLTKIRAILQEATMKSTELYPAFADACAHVHKIYDELVETGQKIMAENHRLGLLGTPGFPRDLW